MGGFYGSIKNMKINVGSKNNVKIEAVREMLQEYEMFKNAEVNGVKALSDVSEQPKSLEETILGAQNRAKNVFSDCDYSFGIESGITKVPETKTGYMDVTACAIYDGKQFHLGLSSAFEYPKIITKYILEKDINASQAFFEAGLHQDEKIGSKSGAIGYLTRDRLTRKDYTKQAIRTALIHLENKELY